MSHDHTKIWNNDLERACEARKNAGIAGQRKDQFQWHTAVDVIRKVNKDIKITKNGSKIYNMPTVGITKTVRETLENIMRGTLEIIPPQFAAFDTSAADYDAPNIPMSEHQLLRNMSYRGGSYAILMAFHTHAPHGVLTKKQICSYAQRFCDDPMDSDYRAGRLHNYGWQSHKTLADKGLLQKIGGGSRMGSNGRWSATAGQWRLSHEAHDFIRAMIEKWGDGGAGGQRDDFSRRGGGQSSGGRYGGHGGGHFPRSFDDDHDDDLGYDPAEDDEIRRLERGVPTSGVPTLSGARGIASGGIGLSSGSRGVGFGHSGYADGTPLSTRSSKLSEKDHQELEAFVSTGAASARKEFNVSHERRKYLHQLIDSGELQRRYGIDLSHASFGQGANRTLMVTIGRRSAPPCRTLGGGGGGGSSSSGGGGSSRAVQTPVAAAGMKRGRDQASGPSTTLGGGAATRGRTPQEMAALAALRRFEQSAPKQATPPSPPPRRATTPRAPASSAAVETIELSDEDDDDTGWQQQRRPAVDEEEELDYWICPQCDEVNPQQTKSCDGCTMPHPQLLDDSIETASAGAGGGSCSFSAAAAAPLEIGDDEEEEEEEDDDDYDEGLDLPALRERLASRASSMPIPARPPPNANSWSAVLDGTPAYSSTSNCASSSTCTAAVASAASAGTAVASEGEVVLLVDERERVSNSRPAGIYLDVHEDLQTLSRRLGGAGESTDGIATYIAERHELGLGDFAWLRRSSGGVSCAGEVLVDGLVERKRIGDLVSRSARGDHIEQLRRMALSPHSRAFLILEDSPDRADGYTAFGANGDATPFAVRDRDDVFGFLASLVIDLQHLAKAIQCPGGIQETRETLCRLSILLPTLPRPANAHQMPSLQKFNATNRKMAAQKVRGELEGRLVRGGHLDVGAASAISLTFGSEGSCKAALERCAPAARSRFLCPILASWAGVADAQRCNAGRRGRCCEQSELCCKLLCGDTGSGDRGGSSSTSSHGARGAVVIALDSDSEDEHGSSGAGAASDATGSWRPSQIRVVRLMLSAQAASTELFSPGSLAPTFKREIVEGDSAGHWIRVWAERGELFSAAYHLCVVEASQLEDAMRHVCRQMSERELQSISNVVASPALAATASRVAKRLLANAPSPPIGPRGRGSYARPATRSVLLLTGLQGMKRGLGKRANESDFERRFTQCAWALAQASVLAVVAEHASWHVHTTTKDKADDYLEAFVRAVDSYALIDQTS